MRRAKATTSASKIPAFSLYGEYGPPGGDLLHVEDLAARSRLYGWEIEAHVHRGLSQVIWLKSGRAAITLDARREEVEGPVALVVPSGAVHGFRFGVNVDGYVLTVGSNWLVQGNDPALRDGLRKVFDAARVLSLSAHAPDMERIARLFDELAAEFGAGGSAANSSPVPGWLARAVVWRLAQACQRADGNATDGHAQQALFLRFAALVEQHYASHWTVARYASHLGLSAERLNRLARAESGKNALPYIHERVTLEACRRLIYLRLPICKVAEELGFEDPAYFCRFFRRRTGQSPRQYRDARADAAAAAAGLG